MITHLMDHMRQSPRDNPRKDDEMDRVAIYLRKSRADLEAEERGEDETLARHKKTLLETAQQMGLNIVKIYQEIITGDSLIHRPEMMKLLEEVEMGLYDGVLVVDMMRLGRGDMQDQGRILDAFKRSGTKIITPRKIYDLDDEMDEEYSEFEAFMARKEFKMIKRRLQQGKIRSVRDGNYIFSVPPYGYQTTRTKDGARTLLPHPEQSKIVRLIFQWYTSDDPAERLGSRNIAMRLNEMGIPSQRGGKWSDTVIRQILSNVIYIGKIIYGKVERRKSNIPGKGKARRRSKEEIIIVDGRHEGIISEELFNKAQEIRMKNRHAPRRPQTSLRNPLAGLIYCAYCGHAMKVRQATWNHEQLHIVCSGGGKGKCKNKSSRLEHVEDRVLFALVDWLRDYKLKFDLQDQIKQNSKVEVYRMTIERLQKEIESLQDQKGRLFDLLERGVYDEETFLMRSKVIADRLEDTRRRLEKGKEDLEYEYSKLEAQVKIIPRLEHILDIYLDLESAEQKNILLKSIIDKCVYRKEKWQRNDQFELLIYPKV